MWVRAFNLGLMKIVVNLNNSVKEQNSDLKHECLNHLKDNSLSETVTVLIVQFLQGEFRRCANTVFIRMILKVLIFLNFARIHEPPKIWFPRIKFHYDGFSKPFSEKKTFWGKTLSIFFWLFISTHFFKLFLLIISMSTKIRFEMKL